MKQIALLILSIVFVLSGCQTLKTTYDYDKNADFSKYKTYNFAPTLKKLKMNDLNKRRLVAAIETQLNAKGFEKSENPDLLIHLISKARQEKSVTSNTDYYGGRPYRWGMGHSRTTHHVDKYIVGTIIIDMVDAEKKEMVWEGIAEDVLDNKRYSEEKINRAVEKVLMNFPPTK